MDRGRIVENLHLEPCRRSLLVFTMVVTVRRDTHIHPTVAVRRNLIVEAEIEVGKHVLAAKPWAGGATAPKLSIAHLPALLGRLTGALPTGQIVSVEETAIPE